jgi:hypothetical protein
LRSCSLCKSRPARTPSTMPSWVGRASRPPSDCSPTPQPHYFFLFRPTMYTT